MALNRVDYPGDLTDQADFAQHSELIETGFLDQSAIPLLIVGGNVPQGVVLQVGGVIYRADATEPITGTASKYARVTASGATATVAYVSSLSGVSWNAQYNGYYDGSGRLYLFDENRAVYDGDLATVRTRYIQQTANGDVYIKKVIAGSINTGQGDNVLHPMNQAVRTTDAVTFATVNTGFGANNLYPMNQAVRNTDSPAFQQVNLVSVPSNPGQAVRADRVINTGDGLQGGGDLTGNRTISVNFSVARTTTETTGSQSSDVNITLPTLLKGEYRVFEAANVHPSQARSVILPSTGVYISSGANNVVIGTGLTVQGVLAGQSATIRYYRLF
jgi:hypothetical protein